MMTASSLLIALLAHALLSLSLTTPTGRWAASRVCTHCNDRGRRGRRQAAAILRVCACECKCVRAWVSAPVSVFTQRHLRNLPPILIHKHVVVLARALRTGASLHGQHHGRSLGAHQGWWGGVG